MDVVGLGYCSLDYLGIVPGQPEFDVDTVSLGDFAKSGGGPVSTALVALARLGARTGYIWVLGKDEGGTFLKGEFEQEGVEIVVITLGAEGCLCLWEDQVIHVPGFQVDVVDTTGAGDAFHGAFLYGLLQEWELERTAIFANAVAAINCTHLSGRVGLPGLSEVEVFLKEKAH